MRAGARNRLKASERTKFKKRLVALERELSGKSPRKMDAHRDPAGEPTKEDEQPLHEMLQSIDSSRNKNLAGALARIEHALKKLEEAPDDYGVCEECGEDIGAGRLNAMPYAELCVGCQDQRDGPRGLPTRKKVTDFQ